MSSYFRTRHFDVSLPKEKIKQVVKECTQHNKHYPKSILSCKQTTLYLFFTYETGKRIKIKTNNKVLPSEWNFETGRYKNTTRGSLELNNELDSQSNTLLKQYIKLKDEREYPDEDEIRQLLQKQVQGGLPTKRNAVDKARADFQARKEQVLTDGTLKEYRTIFKSLDDLQEKEKRRFTFSDFNQAFFDRYEKFLLSKTKPSKEKDGPKKGLFNDTIAKYCATLKSFLQWCFENGYHQNPAAFKKIKTQIKRKSKNEIVALSEEEIFQLLEKDLTASPRLEKVRDLFCFGCFTGQRFSDIMRFSQDDFDGRKWEFLSIKVRKTVVLPFTGFIAHARPILEKYNYTLPVISNQKFNNYLKEIGEIALLNNPVRIIRFSGIKEVQIRQPKYAFMSSHMARRSFVTIMLEKGVPITVVQKITQHADIRTLLKYEGHSENALFESLKKT